MEVFTKLLQEEHYQSQRTALSAQVVETFVAAKDSPSQELLLPGISEYKIKPYWV